MAQGRLSGRSVIITGASQGIGAVYATALAAEGARISASDLTVPEATVKAIIDAGGEAVGHACDVTDAAQVARMVEATEEAFGGVHGLVNNAALFTTLPRQPLEDFSSEAFDRIMAVNVRGAFECMKAVIGVMRRQGYGKIVNIASGTVFKGAPMMVPYVASKGAVVALTRSAAREFGPFGVQVNCLAPGLTLSEGVLADESWSKRGASTVSSRCLQREQLPEDLTGTLGFLLSAESDFMTGQTLVVDGGAVTH